MEKISKKIRPENDPVRARTDFALAYRASLCLLAVVLLLLGLSACATSRKNANPVPGPELMKTGKTAFRHGRFGDAAADFAAAGQWFKQHQPWPEEYEALVSAGQALSFAGMHQQALDDLQEARARARKHQD
ncbi:MAG: hypothetical protein GXO34_06840, partial [Deltaproteobacteria bacterium]|nr:hypothetical protein [Deltaproteobacteria bacterium]